MVIVQAELGYSSAKSPVNQGNWPISPGRALQRKARATGVFRDIGVRRKCSGHRGESPQNRLQRGRGGTTIRHQRGAVVYRAECCSATRPKVTGQPVEVTRGDPLAPRRGSGLYSFPLLEPVQFLQPSIIAGNPAEPQLQSSSNSFIARHQIDNSMRC